MFEDLYEFSETLGNIVMKGFQTFLFILKGEIEWKEVMAQCYRFGITSLPITLSNLYSIPLSEVISLHSSILSLSFCSPLFPSEEAGLVVDVSFCCIIK